MAYNQGKNPFSKNPLNFNSPLNSFDSLVGKLMNQGKSKEAATKIAGKVANMKMKGAGSGPTAAQKARAKGSPAKQAKPDFLDLDKDGNTSESMKQAAQDKKGSPAKMHDADKVKKLKSEISILKNDPEKAVQMGLSTEGQGGIDYEAISQREDQIKAEQAKHDRKKEGKESPANLKEKTPAKLKEKSPAKLKEKSPAKLKSPAEKKLVGKQKNLPEGLKKAIEAAPESPAKIAKQDTLKKKKLMKKTFRCRKGYVPKDPENPEAGCRKMTRVEISKKTADQLNAKDPVKSSPANLIGLIDKGIKAYKAVKGSKKAKKALTSAKAFQNTGKQYVAKIKKAPKPEVKTAEIRRPILDPASTAVGGALGYAATKKKSPINNAYENPEFFTPTKSSYGQDMDNFFNTVSSAYDQTQTDENRLERATRISDKLSKKGKANLSDRQQKRLDKFDTEKTRLTEKIGRSINCPPGQKYNPTSGKCE